MAPRRKLEEAALGTADLGCMFLSQGGPKVKEELVDGDGSASRSTEQSDDTEPTKMAEQQGQAFLERIFGNKKKYNQFNYRLKQACEADQSKYKDLQASGDDDELQVFVEAMLQSRGAPTADIISRKRSKLDEVGKKSEEGWVAWSKAARDEGEDVLLELVEAGVIPSRVRPGLPEGSKIEYPNNLQVYLKDEKLTKNQAARDEQELTETKDAEDPDQHEAFVKDFVSQKIMVKSQSEHDAPARQSGSSDGKSCSEETLSMAGASKQIDEKTKIAMKSLRKHHSTWDRYKREFQGLVTQSQGNQNTQGSKIERDLQVLTEKGIEDDKALTDIEQKFIVKGVLGDDDIQRVADLCASLKNSYDSGKEKATGLKSWFKLS